ncbi:MAG: recombinase family protein [Parasphingopyxis sp.]|uniref:recombinase family protein n=1 Tax=Parasphingopyxis sp. TaxID=1920299 RepID=UPI003FA0EE45
MKPCFGYVRVSTVKQGDGVSLAEQKAVITEYAARKQLRIVKWWEETQTAAKQGRPAFNEMVRELRRGEADGLIIHKIDRSARNFHDWATISDLADSGIGIFIATESFDFNTYGGRMAADFMAVVSANYVRNLRDEIHKGQLGQVKRGLYPWGAPLGYLNNGKNRPKTPDPNTAPLIEKAFELYASGEHSYASLLKEINRRGLRNRRGNPLTMTGLATILGNSFYCGLIRMDRWNETFKGAHKPLISVHTFRLVQQIKANRRQKKVTRHKYLFRGLFHCGLCGRTMIAEQQKGHIYYRCHLNDCDTKTVREEVLEAKLFKQLRHIVFSDEDMVRARKMIEAIEKRYGEEPADATAPLRLAEQQQKMERLTDALIDRLIDRKAFEKRRAVLELEIAETNEQIAQNRKLAQKAREVWRFLELAKSVASTYRLADAAEKRRLVKFATSNRLVHGKKVAIEPSNRMLWAENAVALLSSADTPNTPRTLVNEFCELEPEIRAIRDSVEP